MFEIKPYEGPDLDKMYGRELHKKISNLDFVLAIQKEIMRRVLESGGWGPEEKIGGKVFQEGEYLKGWGGDNPTIKLPKIQPLKKCIIAVAPVNGRLLIKIGEDWWQTRYTSLFPC